MRTSSYVLGFVLSLFCVTLQAADEHVSLEMMGASGPGHIKYYVGSREVTHKGIDSVEIANGSGKASCASATQVNYDGKFERAVVAQWLVEKPTAIEIRVTQRTKIRLTVGNGPTAGVRVERTVEAGLYKYDF